MHAGSYRDRWRREPWPLGDSTPPAFRMQRDISLHGIRRSMEETDWEGIMFKVSRSKVRDLGDFYLVGPFHGEDVLNAVLKACDNPDKIVSVKKE